MTKLRSIITAARDAYKASLQSFTVLSPAVDPYRLDTPAGHRRGQWLADAYATVNPRGDRLHSRGLHYRLIGRVNLPDGTPYHNTDETWTFLSERAIKAARFLGYLPWGALRDARNAPPTVFEPDFRKPEWRLAVGEVEVWLPETLEPRFRITGHLYRQPFRQILIAEKAGVGDILLTIARRYQASLVLPGGELSDQLLYDVMRDASADGRPIVIHQLGDFDPSGFQMAVSTARTAQAIRDSQFPDLDVRVHAVALDLEQCQRWQLPSTPLKDTERRADKWKAAMGREQTELDAAVALVPREFAAVVSESLAQYFDPDLATRERDARDELEVTENARLAAQLGEDSLAEIRLAAESKLAELSELAAEINEALNLSVESLPVAPGALAVTLGDARQRFEPFFDSAQEWATATRRLIARKRYAEAQS